MAAFKREEAAREQATGMRTGMDPYAEARLHYQWATDISTHDGIIKTKYNMIRGTTLQPLQPVLASKEATQRKMAFAANAKVSGSVGKAHGASGMGASIFK